jgi:hypothetical protein
MIGGDLWAAVRGLAMDAIGAVRSLGESIGKSLDKTADQMDEEVTELEAIANGTAPADAFGKGTGSAQITGGDVSWVAPGGIQGALNPAEFASGSSAAAGNAAYLAEGEKLPAKEMLSRFQGENVPGNSIWPGGRPVTYLDDSARAEYRLSVQDGKLYDADGDPFDTSAATTHWSGQGRAIFVMDENGNIYASNRQVVGEFHHSSLLGGAPVAGAGELEVSNGELRLISNNSGHYLPSRAMTQRVLDVLASRGIDVSKVKIDWNPGSS